MRKLHARHPLTWVTFLFITNILKMTRLHPPMRVQVLEPIHYIAVTPETTRLTTQQEVVDMITKSTCSTDQQDVTDLIAKSTHTTNQKNMTNTIAETTRTANLVRNGHSFSNNK